MIVARVTAICLICVVSQRSDAEFVSKPFLVVVDNYTWRHDRQIETYELMAPYLP